MIDLINVMSRGQGRKDVSARWSLGPSAYRYNFPLLSWGCCSTQKNLRTGGGNANSADWQSFRLGKNEMGMPLQFQASIEL